MSGIEDKVVVITGGNSGIGEATAKQFVSAGASVFITGRREPELDSAVKEIGGNVTGIQGDVSNLADLMTNLLEMNSHEVTANLIYRYWERRGRPRCSPDN